MSNAWFAPPALKYGGALANPAPVASSDASQLHGAAPQPRAALGGSLSPSEPLFWAGMIIATAVGCMAYSTIQKI